MLWKDSSYSDVPNELNKRSIWCRVEKIKGSTLKEVICGGDFISCQLILSMMNYWSEEKLALKNYSFKLILHINRMTLGQMAYLC